MINSNEIKIFSNDEVNTGRQFFLDIAKTIAIFGMIFIHVQMVSGLNNLPILFLIPLALLGGVFAAPVFMFCMGIGIAYSRHSTPKENFQRGIDLTIKAVILNILRQPLLLIALSFFIVIPNLKDILIFNLCVLDILHFAGLAFICFALFKKFNFSPKKILVISVILAIIGSLFRNFNTGHLITDIIVGYFMGVSKTIHFESAFPLFHWLIFVAGGYYFGGLLKKCTNLDKFSKNAFIITLPFFISYFILAYTYKWGFFDGTGDSYYHMHIIEMPYVFAAIFLSLSVSYFLSKILNEKILKICSDISKNINEIYIQQWIYIGCIEKVILIDLLHVKFSMQLILLTTVIVFASSAILAHKFKELSSKA